VDPLDDAHWDADLAAFPGATFFHTSDWARVLAGSYGFKPAYFTVRDSGGIRSLLPVMEVDSWLTGRRGVSLPFTDKVAPLAPDQQAFDALYREALLLAKNRGWKYLEFRGGRARFGDVAASDSFLGHQLDLTAGESALFAKLESSTRRAIRKAQESDLTIEFSRDPDSVRSFYQLMCLTRYRHGVPPQPFRFYSSLQRHIMAQKKGWVVLARHGGHAVAGAVYFHFGGTVTYKFGASDEKFQHLRANNLVMWESIKRHVADGFERMDFGRTAADNDGLRRYKTGWGATEFPIDYVRFDLRSNQFVRGVISPTGWRTRLCGILPDPALRLVGSLLYKHIA
jgi:hypothetical protein